MQQEVQGKEKGGQKKAKSIDKKSGKAAKEGAMTKKGKKGGKPALPNSDEEDEDSTFELSEEEDAERGKGKRKPGKGSSGGGGGMLDPVSSKLKSKDLRTAMLEWGSSSSDDEDEEAQDEWGEGGGEALDLEGLKLPVADYVAAGGETRRLAIVDMDWSRVKAVSPSAGISNSDSNRRI